MNGMLLLEKRSGLKREILSQIAAKLRRLDVCCTSDMSVIVDARMNGECTSALVDCAYQITRGLRAPRR